MLLSYSDPVPAIIEIYHVSKSLLIKTAKAFVNRIIPLRARTFIRTFQRLDPYEKLAFSLSKIERIFEPPKMTISKNPKNAYRIIFLCHGNIIRSPMAEALFKQNADKMGLKNFHVRSAGIHAKPCAGADPRSLAVAQEFGVNLNQHRARPITRELIENADAIFVMDSLNEARLLDRYPQSWRKLYPLSSFCKPGQIKNGEISDPYRGDIEDVRRCYHILQACVQRLVTSLVEKGQ
jgi:protein-tyrosine-phosphatase